MNREEVLMFVGAAVGGIVSSLAFAAILWILGIVG